MVEAAAEVSERENYFVGDPRSGILRLFAGKKGLINTTSLSSPDRLYRVLSFHAALC